MTFLDYPSETWMALKKTGQRRMEKVRVWKDEKGKAHKINPYDGQNIIQRK